MQLEDSVLAFAKAYSFGDRPKLSVERYGELVTLRVIYQYWNGSKGLTEPYEVNVVKRPSGPEARLMGSYGSPLFTNRSRVEKFVRDLNGELNRPVAPQPSVPQEPPTNKAISKSDFVRELPLSMPIDEVVAAAAKAGVGITRAHVRTIRWKAKQGGERVEEKERALPASKPVEVKSRRVARHSMTAADEGLVELPSANSRAAEKRFLRLAVDLGLKRANELLAAVEERAGELV